MSSLFHHSFNIFNVYLKNIIEIYSQYKNWFILKKHSVQGCIVFPMRCKPYTYASSLVTNPVSDHLNQVTVQSLLIGQSKVNSQLRDPKLLHKQNVLFRVVSFQITCAVLKCVILSKIYSNKDYFLLSDYSFLLSGIS